MKSMLVLLLISFCEVAAAQKSFVDKKNGLVIGIKADYHLSQQDQYYALEADENNFFDLLLNKLVNKPVILIIPYSGLSYEEMFSKLKETATSGNNKLNLDKNIEELATNTAGAFFTGVIEEDSVYGFLACKMGNFGTSVVIMVLYKNTDNFELLSDSKDLAIEQLNSIKFTGNIAGNVPSPAQRQVSQAKTLQICGCCAGLGGFLCGACGGTGQISESNTRYQGDRIIYENYNKSCINCFGTGKVKCMCCFGAGVK